LALTLLAKSSSWEKSDIYGVFDSKILLSTNLYKSYLEILFLLHIECRQIDNGSFTGLSLKISLMLSVQNYNLLIASEVSLTVSGIFMSSKFSH
jgi:hypothetical protein